MPEPGEVTVLPRPEGTPEPMRPLGPLGLAMWERVWAAGAVWLADRIDAETLLVLCEMVDERATLRMRVLREGDWRQRAGLRALDSQILGALGMLGFNPVDRARLGVAEVAPDSLDEFMARRHAARSS